MALGEDYLMGYDISGVDQRSCVLLLAYTGITHLYVLSVNNVYRSSLQNIRNC